MEKSPLPLITIITVTFNSERTLSDTLNSVLNQNYTNLHHIIIDGASSDQTLNIIESFKSKYKLKKINLTIVSEKDNGIYDAINKGIQLANEGIIGILNSDDVFFSNKTVEVIVKAFLMTNIEIVYSNLCIYDRYFKSVKRRIISRPYISGLFEKSWTPPHPTFYTYKHNYEKFGLYNIKYKIAADGELMFRFLELNGLKSYYINNDLVKMRIGGISTRSIKSTFTITKETYLYFQSYGRKFSLFKYLFYKFMKLTQLYNRNV